MAIFGGNSGYVGYSKSKRAVAAEVNGLRNKSQFDADFRDEVNSILVANGYKAVTVSKMKTATKFVSADEWHHTSKFGNRTDYYSAETIANFFMVENKGEDDEETKRAIEKEFDELISKKIPYTIEYLNSPIKLWVFTAYNSVKISFKGGFSIHNVETTDSSEIIAAKKHFNNEKKSLLISWSKKSQVSATILNRFFSNNPNF